MSTTHDGVHRRYSDTLVTAALHLVSLVLMHVAWLELICELNVDRSLSSRVSVHVTPQ